MSDLGDTASVLVMVCDYASQDTSKLNIIGGGFQFAGFTEEGLTAPQTVVVVIDADPRHYNDEFAFELVLENRTGDVVELPGPAGAPQAMRVAQVLRAEEPRPQRGVHVPRGLLPGRRQVVANFPAGLPLRPGELYSWRVRIDGDSKPDWVARFYVPGPPPAPVLG